MESVRALTSRLIDYAGLFPPAALEMSAAAGNYASYLSGPDTASLGSFVVPVERLQEFEAARASLGARSAGRPWSVSFIVKDNPAEAFRSVAEINASSAGRGYRIDSVELAPGIFPQAKDAPGSADVHVYAEVSPTDDLERMLPQLKQAGARAKLRTGGTTAGAFPTTAQIVRFLRGCCNAGVGFKATAGLHHPVRAQYPLTYDTDSPRAQMYGFLNVFLAAAFMWNGTDDVTAARILNENVPDSFTFSSDAIGWLDLQLSVNRIAAARESFAHSFGSCSFREPVDELALLISSAHAR